MRTSPIPLLTATLLAYLFDRRVVAIAEGILDVNSLGGLFQGIGDLFAQVNTTDIDVRGVMGRWHQMYKAAINFDVFTTQMYCPVAYFKKNSVMGPSGFTMEESFHVISKNGPIETYKRDVSKVGPGKFWVYTEQYFYPHQFYVIKTGPIINNSYEYLVATDQNRLALSVLARDPQQYQLYDAEVVQFLKEFNFGGESFWNQPVAIYHGTDCYYPSEKETFARRVMKERPGEHKGIDLNNPLRAVQQSVGGGQDSSPIRPEANGDGLLAPQWPLPPTPFVPPPIPPGIVGLPAPEANIFQQRQGP